MSQPGSPRAGPSRDEYFMRHSRAKRLQAPLPFDNRSYVPPLATGLTETFTSLYSTSAISTRCGPSPSESVIRSHFTRNPMASPRVPPRSGGSALGRTRRRRSTRHAAGGLLWLAATAVAHQGLFSVLRHHRAARKPRLTRAKGTTARRRRPPRRAAPRRASPRLAAAHAHTHPRARARSARAKQPSKRVPNREPKGPGSNREPVRPPPLAVLAKASKAVLDIT